MPLERNRADIAKKCGPGAEKNRDTDRLVTSSSDQRWHNHRERSSADSERSNISNGSVDYFASPASGSKSTRSADTSQAERSRRNGSSSSSSQAPSVERSSVSVDHASRQIAYDTRHYSETLSVLRQMAKLYSASEMESGANKQFQEKDRDSSVASINSSIGLENHSVPRGMVNGRVPNGSMDGEDIWFFITPKKLTKQDIAELQSRVVKRRHRELLINCYKDENDVRMKALLTSKDEADLQTLHVASRNPEKQGKVTLRLNTSRNDIVNFLKSGPCDQALLQRLLISALKSHRLPNSQLQVVCILIANGASCEYSKNRPSNLGLEDDELVEAPLKLALDSGDLSVLDLVLRNTSEPCLDQQARTVLQLAAEAWVADPTPQKWETISLIAMYPIHCDIFHRNRRGKTALGILISSPVFLYDKLEQIIIGYGVKQLKMKRNSSALTHVLASNMKIDLLNKTLNLLPVDINEQDGKGTTFLHVLACQATWSKMEMETVAELVQLLRPNLALKNCEQKTAIDVANQCCNELLVKFLTQASEGKFRHDDNVLVRDISHGTEPFPIKVVNDSKLNQDKIIDSFVYVRENIYLGDAPQTRSLMRCTCAPGACNLNTCICLHRGLGYSARGTIVPGTCRANPIFECGPHCGCGPDCQSRVVQKGLRMPLEVFQTANRGWGVRALRTIEPGEYIMDFAGEVIESEKLFGKDHDNDWAMELTVDNYEGSSYHVDPTRCGNVARFINHSCDPNLFPVRVYISGEPMESGVRMAMFAAQTIGKKRELTFDYGEVYWQRLNDRDVWCMCNSKKCRFGQKGVKRK